MRQYRIVEVEYANKKKRFYIESKFWWWWYEIEFYIHTDEVNCYHSKQDAQKKIDEIIGKRILTRKVV